MPRSSAITFGAKQLRELGDEQQAALREQRAVLADADSAWSRNSEQSSRVPGVVVGEEKRRRDRVDVERARRVDERADVIVVPAAP